MSRIDSCISSSLFLHVDLPFSGRRSSSVSQPATSSYTSLTSTTPCLPLLDCVWTDNRPVPPYPRQWELGGSGNVRRWQADVIFWNTTVVIDVLFLVSADGAGDIRVFWTEITVACILYYRTHAIVTRLQMKYICGQANRAERNDCLEIR
jgi:hypothetical protein